MAKQRMTSDGLVDEYDPAEWCGLSKSELGALDRLARYTGAYAHFKTVQKHMSRLIALGLAEGTNNTATEKGKELVRKLARMTFEDHGL
jgi:hypothetical protein